MKKLLDNIIGSTLASFYLLGLVAFATYIGFAFGFMLYHIFGGGE